MKAYQLVFKGRYTCFSGGRTLFSQKIYTKREMITDEVIGDFKDKCCDGGGVYDMDRDTCEIKVIEVEIV